MLMHALTASCEELRARTGKPPLAIGLDYNLHTSFCILSEHRLPNLKPVVFNSLGKIIWDRSRF